jgi:hypothetical protein
MTFKTLVRAMVQVHVTQAAIEATAREYGFDQHAVHQAAYAKVEVMSAKKRWHESKAARKN